MALLGAAQAGNMREMEYLLGEGENIMEQLGLNGSWRYWDIDGPSFWASYIHYKTNPLLVSCAANHSIMTYYLLSSIKGVLPPCPFWLINERR